jgi:Secretion system C-terminal sorting domain
MNQTRNTSTLIILLLAFTTSYGQNSVKGLNWSKQNPSALQIVDLNPENGEVTNIVANLGLDRNASYIKNTMHHDIANDLLFFQTGLISNNFAAPLQSQKMIITRASTGQILRTLDLSNAISPFVLSGRNEIGFIGIERESRGYGNNDEGLALVLFNMNSGKSSVRVELANLSFAAVPVPFMGKQVSVNGKESTSEISLSSTVYLPESKEILFSATDVMGVQRMFRINLASGRLVSSKAIDVSILDMIYDDVNKTIQTLYVQTDEENNLTLQVGSLNMLTYQIENPHQIREVSSTEFPITDGAIKFGDNKVFVTKLNSIGQQELYVLKADDHVELSNVTNDNESERIDFEFPSIFQPSKVVTLLDLVDMFPSPAQTSITLRSMDDAKVTYVTIRSEIGQTIKEVKVESNLFENEIDISSLAAGMYYVEIETDKSTPIVKKLIVQ